MGQGQSKGDAGDNRHQQDTNKLSRFVFDPIRQVSDMAFKESTRERRKIRDDSEKQFIDLNNKLSKKLEDFRNKKGMKEEQNDAEISITTEGLLKNCSTLTKGLTTEELKNLHRDIYDIKNTLIQMDKQKKSMEETVTGKTDQSSSQKRYREIEAEFQKHNDLMKYVNKACDEVYLDILCNYGHEDFKKAKNRFSNALEEFSQASKKDVKHIKDVIRNGKALSEFTQDSIGFYTENLEFLSKKIKKILIPVVEMKQIKTRMESRVENHPKDSRSEIYNKIDKELNNDDSFFNNLEELKGKIDLEYESRVICENIYEKFGCQEYYEKFKDVFMQFKDQKKNFSTYIDSISKLPSKEYMKGIEAMNFSIFKEMEEI